MLWSTGSSIKLAPHRNVGSCDIVSHGFLIIINSLISWVCYSGVAIAGTRQKPGQLGHCLSLIRINYKHFEKVDLINDHNHDINDHNYRDGYQSNGDLLSTM